jgi:hypothetical protein
MAEAAAIAASLPVATLDERREARLMLVRYHTSDGDLGVAADVGEEWIAEERGQSQVDEERLISAMRVSWDAFLNAGRLDRAWAVCRELLDISRRLGNAGEIRSAMEGTLVMCLEFDRLDEADRWIEAMAALPESKAAGPSQTARIFLPIYRMELAVRRGNGGEALRVGPPLDECLALPMGARIRGRFVGTFLGARLLAGHEEEARRLTAAMRAYFTRPDRWMDFPATTYARALHQFEGAEAATAFVARYLDVLRRERYRPPAELLRFRGARPAAPTASESVHA